MARSASQPNSRAEVVDFWTERHERRPHWPINGREAVRAAWIAARTADAMLRPARSVRR